MVGTLGKKNSYYEKNLENAYIYSNTRNYAIFPVITQIKI